MSRMHPPVRGTTLLCCIALSLTACNSDASGNGEPGTVKDMPAIHLDQTAELWVDGRNARRAAYLAAAQACEAGGIPTRRLSEADVALVGVTRYEMWLDGKSEILQTRTWDAGQESPDAVCQFKLDLNGTFSTTTATRSIEQDLATGQRSEQPMDGTDALRRFAINAADEHAPQGFAGPVARQVAGQPCDEWTTPNQARLCVWSGGRAWGFGAVRGDDYRPSPNGIVLEATPVNGDGYHVTTQVLSVGQAFAAPTAATEQHP